MEVLYFSVPEFHSSSVLHIVVILMQTLQCNCNEDSEATRIDKEMGNNKYNECSAVWRPVHLRCSLMPSTSDQWYPNRTCTLVPAIKYSGSLSASESLYVFQLDYLSCVMGVIYEDET